ncbi:hypothetical protein [Bacteroides propionicifaciens]|uniref:hypothetical protein n=1 Tax=Bacteroides propionicifaciens TaxID=392838 RepID=UPI000382BEFD|nr:hypothetical protein [Bacteroides propionicifaciens]
MLTGKTLIVADYDIFKKLANEEYASLKIESFLNRYDNVLIGTNEVANMHSVNPRTVLNYIADGLIEPETKLGENDHHLFRMSYALTLDFKALQKQLRARRKAQ